MNTKAILLMAVIGGGAFLAYRQFMKPAMTGDPGQQFPQPNQSLLTQPAVQYPFKPSTPPRVDNQSQPWYGGSRLFNATPDMNLSSWQSTALDFKAGSEIVKSVSSIWDDLDVGGWFKSGGDDFSLDSFSKGSLSSGFDWGSSGDGGWNWSA